MTTIKQRREFLNAIIRGDKSVLKEQFQKPVLFVYYDAEVDSENIYTNFDSNNIVTNPIPIEEIESLKRKHTVRVIKSPSVLLKFAEIERRTRK